MTMSLGSPSNTVQSSSRSLALTNRTLPSGVTQAETSNSTTLQFVVCRRGTTVGGPERSSGAVRNWSESTMSRLTIHQTRSRDTAIEYTDCESGGSGLYGPGRRVTWVDSPVASRFALYNSAGAAESAA